MRSLAYVSLWVFVFAMAWVDAITVSGVGAITRAIGLVAFGPAVLATVMRGKVRPPGVFLLLTTLFVLWVYTTAFWADDWYSMVQRSKTYLQLGLMVWMLWEFVTSKEHFTRLLEAFVLGAGVAAVATIWNYASGANAVDGRYTTAESNANELARTLALAIPMAWYLALMARGSLSRWINRLYVPLGLIGVLLTASRGGLVTALVALTIVPWTMGTVRWRTRIAVGALLVTGAVAVIAVVPQSSWDRLATTTTELQSGNIGDRGAIWVAGLRVFVRHQLLGVGVGGFRHAVTPELGLPFAAHNAFLAVLVEQGLIGLTIFVALFVAAFRLRDHFDTREMRFRLVLFATLIVALMALNWDYAKPMWFVLTMLAVQPSLAHHARSSRGAAAPIAVSAVRSPPRYPAATRGGQRPVSSGGGAA